MNGKAVHTTNSISTPDPGEAKKLIFLISTLRHYVERYAVFGESNYVVGSLCRIISIMQKHEDRISKETNGKEQWIDFSNDSALLGPMWDEVEQYIHRQTVYAIDCATIEGNFDNALISGVEFIRSIFWRKKTDIFETKGRLRSEVSFLPEIAAHRYGSSETIGYLVWEAIEYCKELSSYENSAKANTALTWTWLHKLSAYLLFLAERSVIPFKSDLVLLSSYITCAPTNSTLGHKPVRMIEDLIANHNKTLPDGSTVLEAYAQIIAWEALGQLGQNRQFLHVERVKTAAPFCAKHYAQHCRFPNANQIKKATGLNDKDSADLLEPGSLLYGEVLAYLNRAYLTGEIKQIATRPREVL